MFDVALIPDAIARGIVLSIAGLIWVIVLVRLIGNRTLSKMTAFDFVVTLATGSLLATAAAAKSVSASAQAIAAMTMFLAAQFLLALLRRRFDWFRHTIENEPLVLMRDGKFVESALRRSRVSHSDVYAKIRQADVAEEQVTAVILEATGDISVLTVDLSDARLSAEVRGA